MLTHKVPSKVVADYVKHSIFFFLLSFSMKIRLNISRELSTLQMIHMKCQVWIIFFEEEKNNISKYLIGALEV